MLSETVVAKIAGSVIGSSLALAFNGRGSSWHNVLTQLVVGSLIGFIGGPMVRRYFELPAEVDIVIACSAGCGVVGWMLLKFLLGSNLLHRVLHKHYPDNNNGT